MTKFLWKRWFMLPPWIEHIHFSLPFLVLMMCFLWWQKPNHPWNGFMTLQVFNQWWCKKQIKDFFVTESFCKIGCRKRFLERQLLSLRLEKKQTKHQISVAHENEWSRSSLCVCLFCVKRRIQIRSGFHWLQWKNTISNIFIPRCCPPLSQPGFSHQWCWTPRRQQKKEKEINALESAKSAKKKERNSKHVLDCGETTMLLQNWKNSFLFCHAKLMQIEAGLNAALKDCFHSKLNDFNLKICASFNFDGLIFDKKRNLRDSCWVMLKTKASDKCCCAIFHNADWLALWCHSISSSFDLGSHAQKAAVMRVWNDDFHGEFATIMKMFWKARLSCLIVFCLKLYGCNQLCLLRNFLWVLQQQTKENAAFQKKESNCFCCQNQWNNLLVPNLRWCCTSCLSLITFLIVLNDRLENKHFSWKTK